MANEKILITATYFANTRTVFSRKYWLFYEACRHLLMLGAAGIFVGQQEIHERAPLFSGAEGKQPAALLHLDFELTAGYLND